jgi:PAS domain S-box-containing protein
MPMGPEADTLRLRTALRDLVALSTVPAVWVGREPPAIAAGLVDVLVNALYLDFAFVRLCDPTGGAAVEIARGSAWQAFPEWLQQYLSVNGRLSRREIVRETGGGAQRGCGIVIPIGIDAEGGVVAAACDRADFPTEIDQLLLSVAANHAATAFRMARLVDDHRRAEEALRESERQLRRARDELETKVAERTAELRRSEAYLAEAQRLSHTGSWAFNVATRQFIHSSEEHYRLFGFDSREGMPVWEDWVRRLHPEDRERTIDAIEQRIRERTDFELDYRTGHANGTIKYIHALGHPVFDSSGDLVEFFGTSIDMTERKRAEAALRASEQRWRAVFERAIVGIVTVGLDGRYATANASFQRITGYTEDELRTLTVFDITHEEDRGFIRSFPLEVGSASVHEFEKRYRRKDGQAVWAYVSSFVVPATDTSPAFIAGIVVDITDRKRAEEALRQAQADLARVNRVMLLGEMTASIAHEINQPIAAVITNANAGLRWLRAGPPNLEEVHQALGRIVRDGNHAGAVIHRIRGLARKQLPARRDRSDLNEAIREAVALTQAEVQRHEVNLQMRLADDLPLVPGDRVQLQQVIINLVMNAVEAMDGQGYSPRELTISSGTGSSSDVFVEVQDTGPGLDPADLDRPFQSFYTTKPDGMGLGLAISRSIVEAHGGRLSAAPNQLHGAVFRFTLPVDEPASEFLEALH